MRKKLYIATTILVTLAGVALSVKLHGTDDGVAISINRDYGSGYIIANESLPFTDKATAAEKDNANKSIKVAEDTFEIINEERKENGLEPLVWNDELYIASIIRAKEASETWSHTRPNGSEWYTVNVNLVYGENLGKGYRTAEGVCDGWMASKSHKENILSDEFGSVAVAVYTDAKGNYYWASEFGA